MACFLVPAGEALVVKAVEKVTEKKAAVRESNAEAQAQAVKIPFSRKLHWLCNLLLVGTVLSLIEHIYHGEVVPYYPFLTAMASAAERSQMLYEMATEGVAMALGMTAVWAVACFVVEALARRKARKTTEENN